jgi:hypothetical protein
MTASMIARSGARTVAFALLLAGCAVAPNAEDPFAAAGDSGVRGDRLYVVRFEVMCDECMITYSVAGLSRSLQAFSPGWFTTLRRYPRFPERIRLSASGSVRRVRILVDGDVVASMEADTDGSLPLAAEAVIPPPPAPPEPDSSGSGPGAREAYPVARR